MFNANLKTKKLYVDIDLQVSVLDKVIRPVKGPRSFLVKSLLKGCYLIKTKSAFEMFSL